MNKIFTIAIAALIALCTTQADAQHTTVATSLGIGRTRLLDTYLSPIQYSGPALTLQHERLRATHLMSNHVSFQSTTLIDMASTSNIVDNATQLSANIQYSATWHYNWTPTPTWRIMAGPTLATTLGGIYNTRNGNNPAQAIANLHLGLSEALILTFKIKGHTLHLRQQADLPLIGAMFSPAYQQSYYEIFSLRHYDHNICATHPFNAPSIHHQLSLDIPIRRATIRTTYLAAIRQSHVNNIRHHAYTQAFTIGYVRHISIKHPKEASAKDFIM